MCVHGGFSLHGVAEFQADGILADSEALHLLIFKQGHHIGVAQVAGIAAKGTHDPGHDQHQADHVDNYRNLFAVFQIRGFSLLGIHFGLQNADVGQVAVALIKVQTVTHHEFIGDGEADIICLQGDAGAAALGLIQEGADL